MNPLLFLKFFNFHDSSRIDTGAQTSQAARQVHCSRTDGVRPRALGQGSNQLRRLRRSLEDGCPRLRPRQRT